MQTTTTKAIISRDNLMQYIHEDRDLLMGLQDDLSDMLSATGKFSITLDEIVQNFMPYIPLYLIENEDEIKQAVDVQQTGGIEKDTGSKAVVASKKVSRELGDPFGFLNEFGGIGGGVSNIIPTLLSKPRG